MATKNISISEEAYRRLKGLKRSNESFSIVIARLTGKRALTDLFGVLSRREANGLEKNFKKLRLERRKAEKHRRQQLHEAFA